MTNEEFYQQFEDGTLNPEIFDHANHVKMAWLYLRKMSLPEAMAKFAKDLKNFAANIGAAGLYHETITFAFLILINERIQQAENPEDWENFTKNNPELFNWKENILQKFYQEETLKSEFAKKCFVFPDRKF